MTVNKELDRPARNLDVQVVIKMDAAGNFVAETSGPNGLRVKVELPLDFKSKNPELVAALLTRQDQLRAEHDRKLRETQNHNIDYVLTSSAGNLNARLELAKTCWPTSEKVFNRSWRKHLHGEAGNLSSSKISTKKPAPDFSGLFQIPSTQS